MEALVFSWRSNGVNRLKCVEIWSIGKFTIHQMSPQSHTRTRLICDLVGISRTLSVWTHIKTIYLGNQASKIAWFNWEVSPWWSVSGYSYAMSRPKGACLSLAFSSRRSRETHASGETPVARELPPFCLEGDLSRITSHEIKQDAKTATEWEISRRELYRSCQSAPPSVSNAHVL
jgi:hypothetical protein